MESRLLTDVRLGRSPERDVNTRVGRAVRTGEPDRRRWVARAAATDVELVAGNVELGATDRVGDVKR